MNSFNQLFLANIKMVYRNRTALFFSLVMPSAIYIAISIIPLGKFLVTDTNYSTFVLPGIIAMTIMQSGIYGLAYWMIDLKARGAVKRLLVTPIKNQQLIISLLASRLTVTLIQATILTILGMVIFDAKFAGNIFSSILLVLLGGSIFLLIGLLISNYADTYEASAPITAVIGLPFTFLSNIFYPLETLPKALQTIGKILPITYLADGLRQAYLFEFNAEKISMDILVLTIWLVVLLALTISVFKLRE